MKAPLSAALLLAALAGLAACKETDDTPDTYHDWEARNARWFLEKLDSARAAIDQARTREGERWEDACEWRVYKSLMKSPGTAAASTDYVVCKVLPGSHSRPGAPSPAYSDSVLLHYRGWIMDTEYPQRQTQGAVFSQTYYGPLDTLRAAPVAMPVSGTVEGFQTALQYMRSGDDWLVYIPQQMGYQGDASSAIPAWSTLCFRLTLWKIHQSGTGLEEWR